MAVPDWDEAAPSYLAMVSDVGRGFNHLAADVVVDMLGDCDRHTVLDVGAGEGTNARRLRGLGARVIATEPTHALLDAARAIEDAAPLGIEYCANRAESLVDVASNSVDAVTAVLVLHHVADLDGALREITRVLRPGGRLIAVIPHPWTDHPTATWQTTPEGVRRVIGDYTLEGHWQTDEAAAVRSVGWHHRTLATWLTAMAAAGFVISEVREPTGDEPRRADGGGPWMRVPRFLAISARRP
jgi:2-polyprenyl-3-methyl-5-hydroxy-6-metoxy-1,4-benzoquinol methylase